MNAYEECLSATSTRDIPWYVVPSDEIGVDAAVEEIEIEVAHPASPPRRTDCRRIPTCGVVVARMGTPHSTLKSFGFQSGFGYCGPIASSVSRTMEPTAALRAHLRSAGITCQGAHSVEHL
jgi:hypothetical protein